MPPLFTRDVALTGALARARVASRPVMIRAYDSASRPVDSLPTLQQVSEARVRERLQH